MKTFKKIWWRLLFASYTFIYLPWFFFLESKITTDYPGIHIINGPIDDMIPFCEIFVIPYFLWFVYIAASCVFMLLKANNQEFISFALSLIIGMSVCMIICMIYPNGLTLRPESTSDTILGKMVASLYKTDTPTNVFPSIHVYNSLGAHFAVMNNETLSGKKWVRRGSLILCVSIILSTMFIKQHSMFDVLMAFIMGAVMYAAVYYYDVVAAYRFQTGKRQRKRARIG